MSVEIRGPRELFKPLLPDGSQNQFFGYITEAATRGRFVEVHGGMGCLRIDDLADFTLELALMVAAVPGAVVSNYPCWVAVPSSSDGDALPEAIPGRMNDDGTEKRWSDLTPILQHEGVNYFPCIASGRDFDSTVLVALQAEGFILVDRAAMQQTMTNVQAALEAAEPAAPPEEPAPEEEPPVKPDGFDTQDVETGWWYNSSTNQWWRPDTGEIVAGS